MNHRRWQFSIRDLFALTAATAVFLLLAVKFPELLTLFTLAGGVVLLVLVEGPLGLLRWLPIPRHARLAKFYWLVLGLLFLAMATLLGWLVSVHDVAGAAIVWLLVGLYTLVALLCYRNAIVACKRAKG